jgi:hypothetical protein
MLAIWVGASWSFTIYYVFTYLYLKPFEFVIQKNGINIIDKKQNKKFVPWNNIEKIDKVLFEDQGLRLLGIVLKDYVKEEKDGNKIMLGGDVQKDIIEEICKAYDYYNKTKDDISN